MATKRITDLTNVTSVQDTDLLVVETSEGTRSVSRNDLLDGKAPSAYIPTYNLLKNSNFANPVASFGMGASVDGVRYVFDEWRFSNATTTVAQGDGYITLTTVEQYASIYQKVSGIAGKTLTFAVKGRSDNRISVRVFNEKFNTQYALGDEAFTDGIAIANVTIPDDADTACFLFYAGFTESGGTSDIYWAALYEGTYTVETLPYPVFTSQRIESVNCGLSVQPHNLLDNSDFSNLIAQVGLNGTHFSTQYLADRWYSLSSTTGVQNDDYTTLSTTEKMGSIRQLISTNLAGKTVTIAFKAFAQNNFYCDIYYDVDGTSYSIGHAFTSGVSGIEVLSGTIPEEATNIQVRIYPSYKDGGGSANIYWVAVYEGVYTKDTLPPYKAKEYNVELAECQKYSFSVENGMAYGICDGTNVTLFLPTPQKMRSTPVATWGDVFVRTLNGSSRFTISSIIPVNNGLNLVGTTAEDLGTTICDMPNMNVKFHADL